MLRILTKLIHDEAGATAVEYGLIAALIAVAAVAALTTIGVNLSATFNKVATKLLLPRRGSSSLASQRPAGTVIPRGKSILRVAE